MLYKVTTFSPTGEPKTVEVNAKNMKSAATRSYCLVENSKGEYRRYYKKIPVGKTVEVNKIWRKEKLMYLVTVEKRWQEVHENDKYIKKEKEKAEQKPHLSTYAKFAEKQKQPKTTTAYSEETRDTLNSTPKKTLKDYATHVTVRVTETPGNTGKISGDVNVRGTDEGIWLSG